MRARFEKKFLKRVSGCWEWIAAKHERGYGYFYTHPDFSQRKMDYAHRVSIFLYKGIRVGDTLSVLHICDNPCCVNPDHLRIGTHMDNMLDMATKGRCKSGKQRLTLQDYKLAVSLREQGVTVKDIATQLKCDRSTASRISRGVQG